MTTYTVLNTNDTGAGSLRQAIQDSNTQGGINNVIEFSVGGTIALASDLPAITNDVTVDGNGKNPTIDGNNLYQVFATASSNVTIKNLSITDGLAKGGDGGAGGGGGGAGLGGGLLVLSGHTIVQDVSFSGNQAMGGAGDPGSDAQSSPRGGGGGGGLSGNGGGTASPGIAGQAGTGTDGGSGGAVSGSGSSGGGGGGGRAGGAGGAGGYSTGGNPVDGGAGSAGVDYGGGGGGGGFSALAGAAAGAGGDGAFGGGGGGGGIGLLGDFGGNGGSGGFGGGGGRGGSAAAVPQSGSAGGSEAFGGSGADGTDNNDFTSGGGGAALGGAVFVNQGAALTFVDSGIAVTGASVVAGSAGTGATPGSALGSAIFLRDSDLTEDVSGSNTVTLQGTIVDDSSANGGEGYSSGLTKSGTGTLVLSGAEAYDGATAVNGGALLVNGSISDSTTNVSSGGTLGGSGTTGDVTVANGGALSPGNGPGQITIDGNLTLASGSTYVEQIGGPTAGTGYDQTLATGTGSTVSLSGANLNLQLYGGFAPSVGQTFTIIDDTGTNGTVSGLFAGTSNGSTVTVNDYSFRIDYTSTAVTLTETGVPAAGGGGGGASTGSPTPVPAPTPKPSPAPVSVIAPATIGFDPTVVMHGSTVTFTGQVSAAPGATADSVDVVEGTTELGAATIDPTTGTWSYDFSQPAGFHAGITAVATDSQGLQTSTPSDFDLTTGIKGEPYRIVQDRYDANADFLGQTFFKPSGLIYLRSTYAALPDGGSAYTYKGGAFFDGKDYTAFIDKFAADGALDTHIEYDKGGAHDQEIDADRQTVTALGTDTFADYADQTRFVFNPGFGQDAITGFRATGAGHDTLQISFNAGTLAQVLGHATSDGQGGTLLNLGTGDTLDLVNVSKAELKAHKHDFSLTANV